jgi:hypothetical protein
MLPCCGIVHLLRTTLSRCCCAAQDVQFLVEDPSTQVLEIAVCDSTPLVGKVELGRCELALSALPADGRLSAWLPLRAGDKERGEVRLCAPAHAPHACAAVVVGLLR